MTTQRWFRAAAGGGLLVLGMMVLFAPLVWSADVAPPAGVTGLIAVKDGANVTLTWNEVTEDIFGNAETMDHYDVYRGETPDFIPDKANDTNRIGTAPAGTPSLDDADAVQDGRSFYYLVSAVDAEGNEGRTRDPHLTPPVLSGRWTDTSIELNWTESEPASRVAGYRVYYGKASRNYDTFVDVGLGRNYALTGLDLDTAYYAAVVALSVLGDESDFSNEHVDAIAGVAVIRAHDAAQLCPNPDVCPPKGDEIQRSNGFEIMVPVDFPPGDWFNVMLTLTLESRLCEAPIAPDKCGDTNPGWNPCGDPWDRTASVYLVLNDCIDAGGGCFGQNDNIELLRVITPFGTDADPPDGSGRVPPRVLTYDITPLLPVLSGHRYVGAHVSTWVTKGWWVTTEFRFSKRPDDYTLKTPATGVAPALFASNSSDVTDGLDVTIPASAVLVYMRLFTTGHGGSMDDPNCSNPADEFCPKTNRILVNDVPVWETIPWRHCSSACGQWNACGYPSCTYDRSGWCPGEIACHYDITSGCDQDILANSLLPPGGTYNIKYEIVDRYGSWAKSLVVYWY